MNRSKNTVERLSEIDINASNVEEVIDGLVRQSNLPTKRGAIKVEVDKLDGNDIRYLVYEGPRGTERIATVYKSLKNQYNLDMTAELYANAQYLILSLLDSSKVFRPMITPTPDTSPVSPVKEEPVPESSATNELKIQVGMLAFLYKNLFENVSDLLQEVIPEEDIIDLFNPIARHLAVDLRQSDESLHGGGHKDVTQEELELLDEISKIWNIKSFIDGV